MTASFSSSTLASENEYQTFSKTTTSLDKDHVKQEGVISSTATMAPLTIAALATHNASAAANGSANDEAERIKRLQNAARSLGFELPSKCYQHDKWELEGWLDR